jgi:hypothetical protein
MVMAVALPRDWKALPNRSGPNRAIPTTTTVELKQRHQQHYRRRQQFQDDPLFLTFWKIVMTSATVVVKYDRVAITIRNGKTENSITAKTQNNEEIVEQLVLLLCYKYI